MQHISEHLNGKAPQELVAAVPEPATTPKIPQPATLDELDAGWHPRVGEAIKAAREWARHKQAGQRNVSMVLVASQMTDQQIAKVTRHTAGHDCPTCRKLRLECTGYGCGKTHIARAILWSSRLVCDGVPVAPVNQFMVADDLVTTLAREVSMGDIMRAVGARIDDHRPVLVIDDVGSEKQIPFVSAGAQDVQRHAIYFKAINYCYTNGCSVVLTANLTIEELKAHIGGRAWSRLLQMAPAGLIVDLTGVPDYRRKESGR